MRAFLLKRMYANLYVLRLRMLISRCQGETKGLNRLAAGSRPLVICVIQRNRYKPSCPNVATNLPF
ncbi:hypothetical protein D3C84_1175890 [compost metagenome]